MTEQEAARRLKELPDLPDERMRRLRLKDEWTIGDDKEELHIRVGALLIEFLEAQGYKDLVAAYRELRENYHLYFI